MEYSLQDIIVNNEKNHRKSVFVNKPKLSDLKVSLLKNGIQAEFHGGDLVCNGRVILHKVIFCFKSSTFASLITLHYNF